MRFFFFACGLDSSPPPPLSLSWCTYACVCRGGRALSFVRSPFLLVFRLYLFLIARSSSSFLLRSISFSLFPFFAPYVIIGSLGPSEAGAGADTAVSAVVPEDALDAAIHDVCVFRHYQVNADADRKFECAVRNEIGESLKLDYFGENAERENDGRGGVGPSSGPGPFYQLRGIGAEGANCVAAIGKICS